MEPVLVLVGFLGAGKTSLLKYLTQRYVEWGWQPYVILNDYEDANLDAGQLDLAPNSVQALSGSCICCTGIHQLRECVNAVPRRERGVTLIEANGTSDACALMGFLGVGLKDRFQPPVQISVVDVPNWQKRGEHNELEANQIQVSSLVVLSHLDVVESARLVEARQSIERINPCALIVTKEELEVTLLKQLVPNENSPQEFEHEKTHWASCSVDLPRFPNLSCIKKLCGSIDKSVLRVKGCVKVGDGEGYTYFERHPDGRVYVRAYRGTPVTGAKVLIVGPNSDPQQLKELVAISCDSEPS